ncbi:MAG: DUF4407 domain-containing protein [Bifidobacteriaceae bacterium]|jgi:hypothetical protein|nr:DUF4407 domain-containing protein [Bifidobacteriaceae bacterium]
MSGKWFGDQLTRLGGADLRYLDRVPSSRPGFVQMAFILLTTAGVAALSMFYALSSVVFRGANAVAASGGTASGDSVPGWVIALLALGWGLVILNLDRYLTTSMTSVWAGGKLLAMALIRLALAFVIGVVISTPLVLQVFSSDIDLRMRERNLEAQESLAAKLAPLEAARDEKYAALSGGGADGTGALASPALANARQRLEEATAAQAAAALAAQKAADVWNCDYYGKPTRRQLTETYGDPGRCSGTPGPNFPASELKEEQQQAEKAAKKAAKAVTKAETALREAQDQASEAAESQKPVLEAAYNQAQADLDRARSANLGVADANTGLLSQLTALFSFQGSMRWVHGIVAALFILIELLPVLVKVMKSWGAPNAYDTIIAQEEEAAKRKALIDGEAQADIDHGDGKLKRRVGTRLREKQETDLLAAIDTTAYPMGNAGLDGVDDIEREPRPPRRH